MASKNTRNEPGKIFILGIEGVEIVYSAVNHEIFSRLSSRSAQLARPTGTPKSASQKNKRSQDGLSA